MKTADFFNKFKHHTLGKKRNFGSYRVIDGDTCQVLVRASTSYGVPNGSELIAITFSPLITLWHDSNLRQVKDSVVENITGVNIRINDTILDEDADNLLDSGIIDIDKDNTKMLIEIGDVPWLLEYEEAEVDENWSWIYNVGTKLGVRCTSVERALRKAKMQPNTISALGWTMETMPDGFTPDGISPEDRITLSKPINPLDYGFEIECCQRETTYIRGSVGPDLMFLKKEYAHTTEGVAYTEACTAWDTALSRYADMRPGKYENISCNGGNMVLISGSGVSQLYLKGAHRQIYDSSHTINLSGWHKLLDKSSKIRLR